MAEEIKAGDVLEDSVVEEATEEAVQEEAPALDYTNSFNISDLSFNFFDPEEILPEDYRKPIPEDKKVFIVRYSDIFTARGDKYNSMLEGGNNYTYAAFDKATQAPSINYKLIKGFINELITEGKAVLISVFDSNISDAQNALAKKLVEDTMVNFRIPYSEVVVNPQVTTAVFAKENEAGLSFVTPVPVHDQAGRTMMFMAYSVDVRPIQTANEAAPAEEEESTDVAPAEDSKE